MFVGLKMTAAQWIHVNTYLFPAFIVAMQSAVIAFSLRRNRNRNSVRDASTTVDAPGPKARR